MAPINSEFLSLKRVLCAGVGSGVEVGVGMQGSQRSVRDGHHTRPLHNGLLSASASHCLSGLLLCRAYKQFKERGGQPESGQG